ncbi:MAG TPA: nucleotidyltransferase domain-containing protein [Gemmatimonadaceae bacterium]|nr:nucleotidyltransferase domain-containing protein [Gemmatimonadaceae bacterium]
MMKLEELVKQLELAYGDGLRAVVLFGSAVAGEHVPRKSDYNVLVIVDALPLERLRAVAAVSKAWAEDGNPPPMTFTTSEWRSSGDIFPMEYADILERHRVLFGTPPFDGIKVAPSDLRLQVEQQTMGKLLQLRQATMGAGGDSRLQLEVLEKSLSTLMVIFRGISRLHGQAPSQDYEELSRQLAARAGFSPDPFMKVIRHVRGTSKIPRESASRILEGYLSAMERLVAYLNEFRG